MVYTIELTNNQKKQMDLMCELFHRYVGFNPKLEMDIPIPMKASPAYKKGFEDGKKYEDESYQRYYDNGYNNALDDLSHAMKVYFPLDSEERLHYFGTNIQTKRYAEENPKELIAMAKAYEEKKKAEEVENYHILVDTLRTVTEEYPKETIVSALSEFGFEVDKLREEK